jgi:hypothetical protein
MKKNGRPRAPVFLRPGSKAVPLAVREDTDRQNVSPELSPLIRFPDMLLGLFVPEPRGRLQSLQTPH